MQEHVRSSNRRFPTRDRLFGRNNPPEPPNSRVDYFFDLNDSIATIKLAKAIVIIKVSKTVIQHHPLSVGSVPTTLEKSYSIAIKVYHPPTQTGTYVFILKKYIN
ncbi:hypothetical protein NDK43_10785 [Neobacillus pocheonensis]|uniref:Uncharacterized protein n=1 Tax=Neobacillus pocheonensis TaxID=363869 RepID=A0ABT0WB74_9BACI|nr:hypothetical protein [Neobacillus pocheonensis]